MSDDFIGYLHITPVSARRYEITKPNFTITYGHDLLHVTIDKTKINVPPTKYKNEVFHIITLLDYDDKTKNKGNCLFIPEYISINDEYRVKNNGIIKLIKLEKAAKVVVY